MKLIAKTVFGSHLYGTNTPSSDLDIRGVFIPSKRDILLGRIPRTNKEQEAGKEDDYELFSLHHFVKLACEGQTVAFDMLWTPQDSVTYGEAGWIWDELYDLRHQFLSKRMNAFIGYARGQAAKYSLKGERLNKLEAFVGVLDRHTQGKLQDIWDIIFKEDERLNPQGVKELQICGKWFGATTDLEHIRQSVQSTLNAYGSRAGAAAKDGGIDWKAMSHAVRVSLELNELLTTNEIKFPLHDAGILLEIKQGKIPLAEVQALLDDTLIEVEDIASKSHLPDQVDRKFWDSWLVTIIEESIL